MKKIILLAEDLAEEQQKAKEILANEGFKFVVASTLTDAKRLLEQVKVDGIITDLHFPQSEFDKTNSPCGIVIITLAVRLGVPIVVCSDINHHFADYLKEIVAFMETVSRFKRIPFTMDSKDWQRAASEIKKLLSEKEV